MTEHLAPAGLLDLFQRFMAKVEKGDGCWLWQGARNEDGYGNHVIAGKVFKAHRLAYEFFVGKVKNGNFVCHHCDNPPCVNPAHLFLGTNFDNVWDKIRKGRQVVRGGFDHPRAQITKEQSEEIRASKLSSRALAAKHGISKSHILRIRRGDHWTCRS